MKIYPTLPQQLDEYGYPDGSYATEIIRLATALRDADLESDKRAAQLASDAVLANDAAVVGAAIYNGGSLDGLIRPHMTPENHSRRNRRDIWRKRKIRIEGLPGIYVRVVDEGEFGAIYTVMVDGLQYATDPSGEVPGRTLLPN